jgi:hypothetical protein
MKIDEPKASRPSSEVEPACPSAGAKSGFVLVLWAILGALVLIWVWHWNYNLLGDFYDYSIFASSGGYLHHGLKPYRDFTTSLQSLPIYLCYGAEWLFGPRYLALAFANLIVGLVFYAGTLLLLGKRLPFVLCVMSAMALGVATFFQHGILWYNSVAMMLLALIVWQSANIGRERRMSKSRLAVLCLLIFLSSMVKANFHLLGLFMCLAALSYSFLRSDWPQRKQFVWAAPLIFLSAFVLGPIVEVVVNGTTFYDFFEQVFRTPTGRMRDILPQLLSPSLYFNKAHDFYPDNYSAGIYLTGALIYAICAFTSVRKPAPIIASNEKTAFRRHYLIPIFLIGHFFCSLLLTASNHDIQVLTASYLVVGLIAVYVMFGDSMPDAEIRCFKLAILLLSGIFLIAGGASSFKHSRLRFLESDSDKSHGTASTSSGLSGYFQSVRFTPTASSRLARINAFMAKNKLAGTPEKVYWGPGLEMLNRVYGTCPTGRLPLWYHLHVSVNDDDSPRIIEALEKNHYEWVIYSVYYTKELPEGVRRYLHEHFDLTEKDVMDEGLIILQRKH